MSEEMVKCEAAGCVMRGKKHRDGIGWHRWASHYTMSWRPRDYNTAPLWKQEEMERLEGECPGMVFDDSPLPSALEYLTAWRRL